MPKVAAGFDPALYAPVSERVTLFFASHPSGRIITELVSRTDREVIFKALVYRASADHEPAATGWAAEREGDGDINVVACLENTETSAVGRALANLGFTASKERPSAEEMAKAARARSRYAARPTIARLVQEDPLQRHATVVTDLLRLVAAAERTGLRTQRGQRWRARLLAETFTEKQLLAWERRLRSWTTRQA
jgi:hypothetical protein